MHFMSWTPKCIFSAEPQITKFIVWDDSETHTRSCMFCLPIKHLPNCSCFCENQTLNSSLNSKWPNLILQDGLGKYKNRQRQFVSLKQRLEHIVCSERLISCHFPTLIYWVGLFLNSQHWGRHRIVRNSSDGRPHAAQPTSPAKPTSPASQAKPVQPSKLSQASQPAQSASQPASKAIYDQWCGPRALTSLTTFECCDFKIRKENQCFLIQFQ